MKALEINPRVMRALTWTGVVLVVMWLGALIAIGEFIPPNLPADSAQSITAFYEDNATATRIAAVILIVTGSFWATWGAVIATFLRRMEGGWPVLTYAAIALVGGGYVFFEMVAFFWGVAAFRPGDIDPGTTQTLHDLGWFNFLFTWPPFALLNVIIAVAIFQDRSVPTVYPRWLAYVCLWAALIFVPAGAIIFFKTGAFAWNGLLALYVPLTVFFGWMCAITVATLQAIKREEQRLEREPSRGAAASVEEPHRAQPAGV